MNTPQDSDLAGFKEAVRREWADSETVRAWRKWHLFFARQSAAATVAIVEAAQVGPGMDVLDLASGTGEPALTLARLVGPAGHVTATDLVPEMLAIAAETARQQGLGNLTCQVADAEDLPFAAARFDAVTCRLGVMFFPNYAQALRETYRVLKPGGRAAFLAWGPFDQPFFTSTAGIVMQYSAMPAPAPGTPGRFRFAEEGTLAAALRDAGFQEVRETRLNIPWPSGSVAEAWESTRDMRAPFRHLLSSLPQDERDRVQAAIYAAIHQYETGGEVVFPVVMALVSGRNG
ncbi:MAG TPA: methyltransferase domain-containing protein [Chloroflexia bacterium]|nr:methyltransferase domain-containing protein [Chloroflexia bacterium]